MLVVERRLTVDGVEVATRFPVLAACVAGGHLIVLDDPDADPRSWGTFRNLVSLDRDGSERWVADTSTITSGVCFYAIASWV